MEIYIAGKGVISAIGLNTGEHLQSFLELRSGIGPIRILPTNYRGRLPAGEIGLTTEALAGLSGLSPTISRTAHLSSIAAKEAIKDAGIKDLDSLRTGFISANTVGGMDKTEGIYNTFRQHADKESVLELRYHDSGAITELVADQLGIKDFVTTISTACSSSANAIMLGCRLIRNNMLDVVVAGGTDALSRFTLNGFNALMILDENPCTPFDENRKGLNLGEGAGYIVLVSGEIAAKLKQQPSVSLSGYANTNDAYHQTASSPEGKGNYLAMKRALEMSGLAPEQIDYINLHGTGTINNDLSEGTAVQRLFEKVPLSSSTKTFTGHTLGASGGIEAVFSTMAIEHNILYPNLRFQTQMKELTFSPCTSLIQTKKINHVLSNSFGFGGNCSALIFSSVKSIRL
jgi:3-oxoacyl-[acyl-carrier-protein] synthase-1